MKFSFSFTGLDEVIRITDPAVLLSPSWNWFMLYVTRWAEARSKQLAPKFTHQLERSIKGTVSATPTGLLATIRAGAPHARTVQEGRKPGMRFPPLKMIEYWLGAHGGNPKNAFAVSRHISRYGIAARPFLDDRILDDVVISNAWNMALDRVGETWRGKGSHIT